MSHDTHTASPAHRERDSGIDLAALVKEWKDPYAKPVIEKYCIGEPGPFRRSDSLRAVYVVRDDLLNAGTKARAASALLGQPGYAGVKTLVYVAPRAGWAAISLALAAKDRGLRLILLCPAASEPSVHQRTAYELGAELRFVRVAAMPVLQKYAAELAARLPNAVFLPLGLAATGTVAGLTKVAAGLKLDPAEVWCVASTGVLTRSLQLAWPNARHRVVAVARNLKDGEKGLAEVFSHPFPFLRDEAAEHLPPYPSARNYDAKVWRFVKEHASHGALIWNVAGEPNIALTKPAPESRRNWHDLSDLERN